MLNQIFRLPGVSAHWASQASNAHAKLAETSRKAPPQPFNAKLPIELWDHVLSYCDDRSFANMLNVCVGMRDVPSGSTFRGRIESLNKKAFCPVLPRSTLAANYNAFVRGDAHLAKLTRNGPLLLDDTADMRYAFFSPNSMFVVAEMTSHSSVKIFDLRGEAPIGRTLAAFEGATCIQSVAFSPDSKHVFISSTWGGNGPNVNGVYTLDEKAPRLVATMPADYYFTRATFSPDGSKLATGTKHGSIALWRLDESTATATEISGPTGYVYAVEFSPDGNRLVAASSVMREAELFESDGMACVWDVTKSEAQLTHSIQQERWVWSAHWSPDSTHLLLQDSSSKAHSVWDVSGETASPVDMAAHAAWVDKRRHGEHDFYAGARNGVVEISDITVRPATTLDHRTSSAYVATTNVSPSGRFVVTKENIHYRQMRLYDALARPVPSTAQPSQQGWLTGVLTGLLGG